MAEHLFFVSLYAMLLAGFEQKYGNKVDIEKVLKSAVLHDIEETLTGDIIHGFKHKDKILFEKFHQLSFELLKNFFNNLPRSLALEYLQIWQSAKDNSLEGKIVEAADKLEALIYSIEEYNMGNKEFKKIIERLKKLLRKINLKSVNIVLKRLKI